MDNLEFPGDFFWGTAASSYQTEGGNFNTDWYRHDLDAHIRQIHKAISDGMQVKGYMCWSLTDNFEWGEGYSKKFGLIGIDFATQERSVKEGGKWYAGVISRNGLGGIA